METTNTLCLCIYQGIIDYRTYNSLRIYTVNIHRRLWFIDIVHGTVHVYTEHLQNFGSLQRNNEMQMYWHILKGGDMISKTGKVNRSCRFIFNDILNTYSCWLDLRV